MIGQRISHYEIIEKLGSGASGEVYKARDLSLARFVALKFLKRDLLLDEESRQRFKKEARAVSTLDHPNIATIYEIVEVDDSVFISMAYYKGTTLQQLLSRGPLSFDEIRAIAIQIAQGLAEAHGIPVTHRDIKPANIMVTETGQVRILDFGLAKVMGSTQITQQDTMLGTLAYMSPEVVQGQTVDHRTDIFSFGAVLYEMIAGAQPFCSEYAVSVIYSIVNEDPPPLFSLRPDTPKQLEEVVNRALAKDVSDRYQSAREIETELSALQLGAPDIPRVRRPSHRFILPSRRWTMIGGILLLILILSSFIVFRPEGRPGAEIASIAVMPFSFQGDEELSWLGKAMTDLVRTNLDEVPLLQVLGPREQRKIMQKHGLQDSILNKAHALQIANDAQVNSVLLGEMKKVGETIQVQGQVFEATNGQVVAELEPLESKYTDLGAAAAKLSSRLVSALSIQNENLPEAEAAEMPSSLEAFRFYIEGRDAAYDLRHEEGIAKLNQAISLDSTFIKSYYLLAWLYVNIGETAKAKRVLARGKPYISKSSLRQRLAYLKTEANIDRRWRDYSTYVEQLLRITPYDAKLHFGYGFTQYSHFRNLDAGIAAMRKAVQLDSTYSYAYLRLGHAYLAKGAKDSAFAMVNKGIALDPTSINARDSMVELLLHVGRYQEAISLCQRILTSEPNHQDALLQLSAAYREQGKYALALEVLGGAVIPTMPAKYRSLGHLYRGHIYFLRGRPEDALQSVARSIELDSTNVEAHWLRGRALLALKREDDLHDELAQLKQAVTAKGGLKYRWFIYHLQGEMALQGGDFERAVDSFENALQLAPRDRSFYLSALAGAYAKSGQIQNALSQYDAALEFNPNNAMAHFEVANIYKRNGRLSDAVEAYKRVVEILAGADEENYQLLTARKEI